MSVDIEIQFIEDQELFCFCEICGIQMKDHFAIGIKLPSSTLDIRRQCKSCFAKISEAKRSFRLKQVFELNKEVDARRHYGGTD